MVLDNRVDSNSSEKRDSVFERVRKLNDFSNCKRTFTGEPNPGFFNLCLTYRAGAIANGSYKPFYKTLVSP